jgi:hypothetical protein
MNLGSPKEMTVLELAETVIEVTGSRSEIVYEALPQDDPRVRQPDISTARDVFGWEAPASWLHSVNAIFIILLAPVFGWLWVWLAARNANPSIPMKFALGLLGLAGGFFVLAWGAANAGILAAQILSVGDAALRERYIARMRESAQTDAQEEARFRNALVNFEDPALVRRTAEAIFTDLIRDQDRALLYLRLLASRHSREIGWKALQRHWDSHVVAMDPAGKQRCVTAASQLSPAALSRQAVAFLTSKQTPDLKETVAQAVERVRLLSATAEKMSRELASALGSASQPG